MQRSQSQSIVRGVLSNWSGMAVTIVLSFVLAPIVVRSLGDVWYGVWALTLQLLSYLWLLDLGIRDSVVRYVARHRAQGDHDTLNEKISIALYLYVGIAILTMVIGAAIAAWGINLVHIDSALVPTARVVIMLTALSLSFTWLSNPFIGTLMGLQRFDVMNGTSIATTVFRFVASIVLLKSGFGIIALAAVQVATSAIAAAAMQIMCRRLMPQIRMVSLTRARKQLREVWSASFYIVLNNIAMKISFATDGLVIASHLPVQAVTYFAIPSSLVHYLINAIRSMSQVLYPRTSALQGRDNPAATRALFLRGAKFSAVLGLPVGAIYLTVGSDFISLWMGPEYAAGSTLVLQILAVAHMFTLPHYTTYYVLLGLGRQRPVAALRFCEAAANLALSIALVRVMGIEGVALGTAIAHIAAMGFVLPTIASRQLSVPARVYLAEAVLKPTAAVLPVIAGGFALHAFWPAPSLPLFGVQVAALCAVYLPMVWWLCCSNSEREMVTTRLVKLFRVQAPAGVGQ